MACHGGFALDEAARRLWCNPEAVLQDLRVGMVFRDIGCGDGFFSILVAKRVGEEGEVYAVGSDASAIERLNCENEAEGLKNIFGKIGLAEETVFCQY